MGIGEVDAVKVYSVYLIKCRMKSYSQFWSPRDFHGCLVPELLRLFGRSHFSDPLVNLVSFLSWKGEIQLQTLFSLHRVFLPVCTNLTERLLVLG